MKEESTRNRSQKEETFRDRLRETVYREKIYEQFRVDTIGKTTEEEIETIPKIYEKVSSLSLEELIIEAGIDITNAATGEEIYQSAERYISQYAFSADEASNSSKIKIYLKTFAYRFVDSTIKSGNEEEKDWHKLASYIWRRIDHQIGGVDKMQSVINSRTDEDDLLLEELLAAIRDTTDYEKWEDSIHDAYLRLKKAVLLKKRQNINRDPEWEIHRQEGADSTYYADLLNNRVLSLWKLTKWGKNNGKLINYLRSERGEDTYASWFHPDGDALGDRKKESCYYLVSRDGVAIVREHNECLYLTNEQDLLATAMTIIQDVVGDIDMKELSEVFYKKTFKEDFSSASKEDIINALLEKRFSDKTFIGIEEQFDIRLEMHRLSMEDLRTLVSEEGFIRVDELLTLYGRNGALSKPDPEEIELIASLQYLPDDELAGIVDSGDLKTIHDHIYDFYISNDSGATYREYFDKGLILLMLDYHKKSDEVFRDLVNLEFKNSHASNLNELVDLEPDAKEYCVDYIWDKGITGRSGQDLSSDFLVFALKKISSDHAKLTRRLSKTLLKSIDPDQKLIKDFSNGDSGQETASDGAPEMPSDPIVDSITREQLINAMVNEWIVDCYCAPDEGDDPPEVKRQEFEAMPNAALLKQLNFDKDYTIHDYIDQYSQIAEGYMKSFKPTADDLQNASEEERSIIDKAVRFIKDFRNKF